MTLAHYNSKPVFMGKYKVEYVGMSAGAVIAVVFPYNIGFDLSKKYLIKGLTAGAIKGQIDQR